LEVFQVVNIQGIQQNLNQISQICSQLSQNEQSAAQQMQRCLQLANQVSQQLQQLSTTTGTQYASPGQFNYSVQPPVGGGQIGMGQQSFSPGGQQFASTSFEVSKEFGRGENEGDGGAARSAYRPPSSFTSGSAGSSGSFTSSTGGNYGGSAGGGLPTYNTNKDIGQ